MMIEESRKNGKYRTKAIVWKTNYDSGSNNYDITGMSNLEWALIKLYSIWIMDVLNDTHMQGLCYFISMIYKTGGSER